MEEGNNSIGHDLLMFGLMATIIVSLASYVSSVNSYVLGEKSVRNIEQIGLVVSSTSNEAVSPLVMLLSSPGIIQAGERVTLQWTISKNAASCEASSEPENRFWSGNKESVQGVHSENIGDINEATKFSIECREANGRASVSSMGVIVK